MEPLNTNAIHHLREASTWLLTAKERMNEAGEHDVHWYLRVLSALVFVEQDLHKAEEFICSV